MELGGLGDERERLLSKLDMDAISPQSSEASEAIPLAPDGTTSQSRRSSPSDFGACSKHKEVHTIVLTAI